MGNNFKICYDGPALASHEMNVKDLAPALLSVGELLEDANRILNGDKTKVAVNIKATTPGSVNVDLSLIQQLIPQLQTLFNSPETTAIINAKELLSIVGIGGGGLIGFVMWLRGRKIKNITTIETKEFKVEVEDGETKIVSSEEIKLFSFLNIRKNLEAIIKKPLENEGVEKVCFKKDDSHNEIIREQKDYFIAPEVSQELIDDRELEMSLQIMDISFRDGGKWRFSDGNANFFAEIQDESFNMMIAKNEVVFAKDDILKVSMRRRQYLSDGSIKTDYEIIKIIEHRSAAIQIKLPFSNDKK